MTTIVEHAGHCLEYSIVIDSRQRPGGIVYRKRRCRRCQRVWTTNEVETTPTSGKPAAMPPNQRHEAFDRD